MKPWLTLVPALAAPVIALAAAAPQAPVSAPDPAALFKAKCAVCHDARGWASVVLGRESAPGQGVLTARTGMKAADVRQIIRRGVGEMPGFMPTELTDADVAAIAAWLEK